MPERERERGPRGLLKKGSSHGAGCRAGEENESRAELLTGAALKGKTRPPQEPPRFTRSHRSDCLNGLPQHATPAASSRGGKGRAKRRHRERSRRILTRLKEGGGGRYSREIPTAMRSGPPPSLSLWGARAGCNLATVSPPGADRGNGDEKREGRRRIGGGRY